MRARGAARSDLKLTTPGVLIAGLNPVSTDAVGTAVMGYADPRAARGVKPFQNCDNHLLLAEQAGLGIADLAQIDVRGMPIEKARTLRVRAFRPDCMENTCTGLCIAG